MFYKSNDAFQVITGTSVKKREFTVKSLSEYDIYRICVFGNGYITIATMATMVEKVKKKKKRPRVPIFETNISFNASFPYP